MSRFSQCVWLTLAAAAAAPAAAQDEARPAARDSTIVQEALDEGGAVDADGEVFFDREPVDCLTLSQIRRTEIIDDATIVFYTRRNEPYVNNLPRRCPGLRVNSRFQYEVRQTRLCETDWITVLERFAGGFGPGFTCRLGVFHPTSQEIVDILKSAAETGMAAPTSTATPVERPDGDDDAAAEDGAAEGRD